MCQLLALSCNAPTAATFSFTGLAARGGGTADHADGFGLAFHDGPACRVFIDEAPAADSPLARFLSTHPIRARLIVGHVRKATQGQVELSNCHPFVREWGGRHWSFCHNGDLKDFRPRLTGPFRPVGTTDSEHAFCWMLQSLRARFRSRSAPRWSVLAPAIAELATEIGRHGTFNFVLADGAALYVGASTKLCRVERSHPFPTAHLVDCDLTMDLAASNGPDHRMIVVATEALTRNEPWIPFEPGSVHVLVDGAVAWNSAAEREPA